MAFKELRAEGKRIESSSDKRRSFDREKAIKRRIYQSRNISVHV